ncbi:MAG TPA: HAMP domain-containing histidine kinase [Deltaproteobacteria bacterium]|nr:HAMP domain-containing histidine kinase [Deltaproteobacteria bacterium]
MFATIRARLVAWSILVFTFLLTGLGLFLRHELEAIVIGSVDGHLHSEMVLISGLLEEEEGRIETELSEAAVGEYAVPLSGHYYQIIDERGRIVAASPSLTAVGAALDVPAPSIEPIYSYLTGPGKTRLRMLVQSFALASGRTVTIQATEPLEDAFAMLASFTGTLFAVIPAVGVVSALGVWLISLRSFKPLRTFTSRIGEITERNLHDRLDTEGLAGELAPLAESFNTMIARLEASFERQRRFLSEASHELRTPTSIIKTCCDVALARERGEEEYRETLRKISDATAHLSATISRIIDILRLEGGGFTPRTGPVSLDKLAADIKRLIEPAAAARRISLSVRGEGDVVVTADPRRLAEALTNLVDNAVKYNRPGGSVVIGVSSSGSRAVIAVEDTGTGMSPAELEKVFDRFYRGGNARGRLPGSGLGLAIVKAAVESMGGSVEAESTEGKGSTFRIILPLGGGDEP